MLESLLGNTFSVLTPVFHQPQLTFIRRFSFIISAANDGLYFVYLWVYNFYLKGNWLLVISVEYASVLESIIGIFWNTFTHTVHFLRLKYCYSV